MSKQKVNGRETNFNKLGFTLIELLAVLIILVVIALITIPIILNAIENSRKKAFLDTAYGILKSADLSYFKANEKEVDFPIQYQFLNGNLSDHEIPLEFKGTHPKGGDVFLYKNGEVQLALWDGKYCVAKKRNETEIKFVDQGEEECAVKPLISPSNGSTQYAELGEEYELTYQAISLNGEDITENVVVTIKQDGEVVDSINTMLLGRYQVTYYVEDGQTSTTNETTVIVRDTKAPVITLNDSIEDQVTAMEASKAFYVPLAEVTDNSLYEDSPYHITCGEDSVVTENGGSCIGISSLNPKLPGEYEILYKAVDESGNEATLVYTVTVTEDVTAPEILFTSDAIIPTSQTTFNQRDGVVLLDNVSNAEDITLEVTGTITFGTVGNYPLTYKATDEAGNSSEKERTVKVIEGTTNFPYTGAPQNYPVPADGYYEISVWGASGGTSGRGYGNWPSCGVGCSAPGTSGGAGGYIKVKTYLPKGETITILVGGAGGTGGDLTVFGNQNGVTNATGAGGGGGYNGGARGSNGGSWVGAGGGGGGATTASMNGSMIAQGNGGGGARGGGSSNDPGGCGGAGGGGTAGGCGGSGGAVAGSPGGAVNSGSTKYGNIVKIESTNGARRGHGQASIKFVGTENTDTTFVYDYSGSPQKFFASKAGTYEISVWGASGGASGRGYGNWPDCGVNCSAPGTSGGLGGYVKASISLGKDAVLDITVGGAGGTGGDLTVFGNTYGVTNATGAGGGGGYNGGTRGSNGDSWVGAGGGGGGMSTVSVNGVIFLQGNGGSGAAGGGGGSSTGGCGGNGAGGAAGACPTGASSVAGRPGSYSAAATTALGPVTFIEGSAGARSGHGLVIIKYVG